MQIFVSGNTIFLVFNFRLEKKKKKKKRKGFLYFVFISHKIFTQKKTTNNRIKKTKWIKNTYVCRHKK
jgi:hypothetical protein